MKKNQTIQKTVLGNIFEQYRTQLMKTISWHTTFALKRKMDYTDIFQDAYLDALSRLDYLNEHPEISILVKLRGIVIQTIANKKRYCRAAKRDVSKEVHENNDLNQTQTNLLNRFADKISSPSKKMLRKERAHLVHQIISQMKPRDREIIIMRHFDQMSFADCAMILNINVDAAKMRYARAIERFKNMFDVYMN
ncbi:MAG: sigma-70 family RNA polymerase sigma factor [Treponema sp.]|nr:sigma-70 family RNA polymerase sigma factor [Treponema sp.]